MFGIKQFSAIINPPQTAILAVGSGREELGKSIKEIYIFIILEYVSYVFYIRMQEKCRKYNVSFYRCRATKNNKNVNNFIV